MHARSLASDHCGFFGRHDEVRARGGHDLRLIDLIVGELDRPSAQSDSFSTCRAFCVCCHLEATRHGLAFIIELEHSRGQVLLARLLLLILLVYQDICRLAAALTACAIAHVRNDHDLPFRVPANLAQERQIAENRVALVSVQLADQRVIVAEGLVCGAAHRLVDRGVLLLHHV